MGLFNLFKKKRNKIIHNPSQSIVPTICNDSERTKKTLLKNQLQDVSENQSNQNFDTYYEELLQQEAFAKQHSYLPLKEFITICFFEFGYNTQSLKNLHIEEMIYGWNEICCFRNGNKYILYCGIDDHGKLISSEYENPYRFIQALRFHLR